MLLPTNPTEGQTDRRTDNMRIHRANVTERLRKDIDQDETD